MTTLHIILLVIALVLVIPMIFAAGSGAVSGTVFGLFMLFIFGSLVYYVWENWSWRSIGMLYVYTIGGFLAITVIALAWTAWATAKLEVTVAAVALGLLVAYYWQGHRLSIYFLTMPVVSGMAGAALFFAVCRFALYKVRAQHPIPNMRPLSYRLLKYFTALSLMFFFFYLMRAMV